MDMQTVIQVAGGIAALLGTAGLTRFYVIRKVGQVIVAARECEDTFEAADALAQQAMTETSPASLTHGKAEKYLKERREATDSLKTLFSR